MQQENKVLRKSNRTPVFLYVPNIVGYVRVSCILVYFFLYDFCPAFSTFLYLFNIFLDYLDGILARRLNQCSKFGALLDVITDKVGTASLIFKITQITQNQFVHILLFNQIIETAGNWILTFNSFYLNTYHKGMIFEYQILNLYYRNRYYFLDILVAFNELFHSLLLYKLTTQNKSKVLYYFLCICFVFAVVKSGVGILRMCNVFKKLLTLGNHQ